MFSFTPMRFHQNFYVILVRLCVRGLRFTHWITCFGNFLCRWLAHICMQSPQCQFQNDVSLISPHVCRCIGSYVYISKHPCFCILYKSENRRVLSEYSQNFPHYVRPLLEPQNVFETSWLYIDNINIFLTCQTLQ